LHKASLNGNVDIVNYLISNNVRAFYLGFENLSMLVLLLITMDDGDHYNYLKVHCVVKGNPQIHKEGCCLNKVKCQPDDAQAFEFLFAKGEVVVAFGNIWIKGMGNVIKMGCILEQLNAL
nr:hypothetical protein [Tanacetum cinerariifolium]